MITRYRHVVEIGAGDSHSSEGLRWSTHADHVSLYEPHQLLWGDLIRAAAGMDNVTVHQSAVYDPGFACPLYHMGYASFLQGVPSFLATSVERDGEKWWAPLARPVPIVCVGDAIPVETDLLILTPNGAEGLILQQMVARPKTIQTKHYLHNARQWQVAQNDVFGWMQRNGYRGRETASNQHRTHLAVTWTLDSGGQPT